MKQKSLIVSGVFFTLLLGGCAAGSATAGWSAKAGTADDLGSESRGRIVNESVSQSKAYTDAEIAKLRAEVAASHRGG